MAKAKSGDTIKVHYTGRLGDGTEFDSSSGQDPIEFTIGANAIIPALELAMVGMEPGESKSVTIVSVEAYGSRDDQLVQVIERGALPEHLEPEVGMQLQATGPNDQMLVLTITDISDANVTVDANHPLAGHDLTFDVELVQIV